MINQVGQGIFYLAATCVAGTQHYGRNTGGDSDYGYGSDESQRSLLDASNLCSGAMDLLESFANTCGLHLRSLAEASEYDTKPSADSSGYGGIATAILQQIFLFGCASEDICTIWFTFW